MERKSNIAELLTLPASYDGQLPRSAVYRAYRDVNGKVPQRVPSWRRNLFAGRKAGSPLAVGPRKSVLPWDCRARSNQRFLA